MGKTQRRSWQEAIRLCRLNQNDVGMAKRLGFRPDALVRAIPDPKQRWKVPVKQWVRELYFERFGCVPGGKQLRAPDPLSAEPDPATRLFEEQVYWEDYWDRNEEDAHPAKGSASQANPPQAPGDNVPF